VSGFLFLLALFILFRLHLVAVTRKATTIPDVDTYIRTLVDSVHCLGPFYHIHTQQNKHTPYQTINAAKMHTLTISTIVVLLATLGLLNTWIKDPSATVVERNVHTTLFYSLAGGAAVNAVCAGVVRAVKAVPPGEEVGACTPYGLMGGGIAARLHMYWINGYTRGEWAYIGDAPSRTTDRARELVGRELRRLGLWGGREEQQQKAEL
jgi:hypothetical protein